MPNEDERTRTPEIVDAGPAPESERNECALPERLPPRGPKITGLDLSLSATGLAGVWGQTAWAEVLRAKAIPESESLTSWRRFERIDMIGETILDYARGSTLVVVEGPVFYIPPGGERGYFERAELFFDVTRKLRRARIPFAVAAPKSIKLYATGKGNAKKDAVLTAMVRRVGPLVRDLDDNNAADALAAAMMGADWLGYPLVPMPEVNRRALPGVDWRIEGNPGAVAEALETAAGRWAGE